jgi:hypothetical protein
VTALVVTERRGEVYSWGHGAFGKLGHGTDADVRIPKQVEFKRKRIARVSCGPDHSAAVSEAGEILCWGAGLYGALGHGDGSDCLTPKLVDGLLAKRCVSVACGAKARLPPPCNPSAASEDPCARSGGTYMLHASRSSPSPTDPNWKISSKEPRALTRACASSRHAAHAGSHFRWSRVRVGVWRRWPAWYYS